MDGDVEKLMWQKVSQVYGDSLSAVLRQALAGYKRTAGLDDLTRLYPSTAGIQALQVLKQELISRWPKGHFGDSESCLELRSRLRSHLIHYLLRRLVKDEVDTPILRDALFGGDVGA
ncbi:hypothetical protein [Pseudomonas fluorescens]|uniref:hypothetical protein n=1 Tax=Pseudomonas fluorescens TaxID=294 RepID=UPI00124145C1|nr:hypothetical protein [Pseudomonas fluorescens]